MKTKQNPENERNQHPKKDPRQQRSVLWIGFVLLISGWMFFLGVLVGRGTAPALFDYQQIETEITALAKIFTESRKTQPDMVTDTGLEYPVELKKEAEDNTLQMPTQEKPPVRPAETPRPVQQEIAQATVSPPAKPDNHTVVKPETAVPTQEPAKTVTVPESRIKSMYDLNKISQTRETPLAAPERTPPAVPKPRAPAFDSKAETVQPIAIHLTSMVDKKSADILIEILRNKGISASKTPKMIRGKGVWYTVVVGKYTSSAEADAMLNRLKQENMDASLIRQ
jgi:septal ring-binding cell division protein DamX